MIVSNVFTLFSVAGAEALTLSDAASSESFDGNVQGPSGGLVFRYSTGLEWIPFPRSSVLTHPCTRSCDEVLAAHWFRQPMAAVGNRWDVMEADAAEYFAGHTDEVAQYTGFTNPLTHEYIPRENFDQVFFKRLRIFYRAWCQTVREQTYASYDKSHDSEGTEVELLHHIEEGEELLREIRNAASWYGTYILHDANWASGYCHRLSRPGRSLGVLAEAFAMSGDSFGSSHILKYRNPNATDEPGAVSGLFDGVRDTLFLQVARMRGDEFRFEVRVPEGTKVDRRVNPSLNLDWALIEEAVEELAWNAAKYGATYARVEWDEATSSVVVTNDGPGLPTDRDVFANCVRGEHPDRSGSGHGLANLIRDCESEGWTLTRSSQEGRTVFRLRLG